MNDEHGADVTGDPRVQEGIEHLQRAAREVIAASRSLLDAAEDVVEDPETLGRLTGIFGAVAEAAGAAVLRSGRRQGASGIDDEGDDDSPVQRIPVS